MTVGSLEPYPTLVGIDVGGTKVRALVSDLQGRVTDELREPTSTTIVDQVTRIARDMGGPLLAGVGVGVPGAVDPSSGRISRIPNVPNLDGVCLADELQSALGVPVAVDNDLAAAALAEVESFPTAGVLAVIAAGTGVGLGTVHAGSLLRGATGAAGEIADIPVGGKRTLEDVVSIAGLREAYALRSGRSAPGIDEILTLAERGDTDAVGAVSGYCRGLAHGIRIVFAVLDPDVVVLTGGLTGSRAVLDALENVIFEFAPRIRISSHGVDAPAHGAVELARQRARRQHPTELGDRSRIR